ncbi:MAG: hypothetical protein WD939_10065 [Dehalococcoidia bacterium]
MVTEELMRAVAQERQYEAAAMEREAKLRAFLRESDAAIAKPPSRSRRVRIALPSISFRRVVAAFGRA